MDVRRNIPLLLAIVVLALALAQAAHLIRSRLDPTLLFLVSALLFLRWVLRRQAGKRASLVDEVPQRPLGISEDSPKR